MLDLVSTCADASLQDTPPIISPVLRLAQAAAWMAIATEAKTVHQTCLSALDVPGSDPASRLRHEIFAKHHYDVLITARREVRDALAGLPGFGLATDILFERDALDLACAELDRYLARTNARSVRPE